MGALDKLIDAAAQMASGAAKRAAAGAVAGAKREFSPDASVLALKTLDAALAASDPRTRRDIADALRELADKHDPRGG